MEYLEKKIIPEERVKEVLSFDFWNPIIKSNFIFFELNGLFHLDTAHRNVFFTLSNDILKLAIIDYGESDLVGLVSSSPQPSGYLKTTSDSDFFYKYWLKNKALSQFGPTGKYFDDPDDPEFKKTMNDYIFGGVINKHTFKKSINKSNKSKKGKSKKGKSKKGKSKKGKSKKGIKNKF